MRRLNKNVSFVQVTRLEQTIQQLQLTLSSAHQRHKSEGERLEGAITSLEKELADTQLQCSAYEEEVNRKEEQIKRNEAEILSCRDDIKNKVDEVCMTKQRNYTLFHDIFRFFCVFFTIYNRFA